MSESASVQTQHFMLARLATAKLTSIPWPQHYSESLGFSKALPSPCWQQQIESLKEANSRSRHKCTSPRLRHVQCD